MTPTNDGSDADSNSVLKRKKRKTTGRKLLSFDDNGEEPTLNTGKPPAKDALSGKESKQDAEGSQPPIKRTFKPNPNASLPVPKALTKASLVVEAAEREKLRAEFIKVQELVRNSDIAIPFVFYDGSSQPGGTVKVRKGEQIWLFLERCRKLGAEMGVSSEGSVEGGGSKRAEGKKSWARIGVDDLMLVRGDLIIPHHYDFYHFVANKVADPSEPGRPLFDYKDTASLSDDKKDPLMLRRTQDEKAEGHGDDPSRTKVVDRRWYEKNKHIYPASLWCEYKTGKNGEEKGRRDVEGNTFFFA